MRLLLILTILFFPYQLFCQVKQEDNNANYSVIRYTSENGLPQNSIKDIAFENNGFVWLLTESGLVRFDGERFVVFNSGNSSISSNRFIFFENFEKQESFHALNEKWESLQISNGKATVDKTYGNIAKKISNIKGRHYSEFPTAPGYNLFPAYFPQDNFILSPDGIHFYMTTPRSISFCTKEKDLWIVKEPDTHQQDLFLLNKKLYRINAAGKALLYEHGAVKEININGDILQSPAAAGSRIKVFWNQHSTQVLFYANHNFYLAAENADGSIGTKRIIQNFDITTENICCVRYDEAGGALFAGTYSNGLLILKKKTFTTLKASFPGIQNVFYGQVSFRDSGILTSKGVLFDAGKEQTPKPPVRFFIASDADHSILIDRNKNIWRGLFPVLLIESDQNNKVINQWNFNGKVNVISEAPDGKIWVGLEFSGLYRVDPQAGQGRFDTINNELPVINFIYHQNNTIVWVATIGGLFTYHTDTKKTVPVRGLENISIRGISQTTEGIFWITTYGHGFYMMYKERLYHLPSDKNEYLLNTHCIWEDKKGIFWITTNNGLFRAAKADLINYVLGNQKEVYYDYHGKVDGLNTNEFNGGCQPCALELPDGRVSFPSMDGLVIADPAAYKESAARSNVFIDKIILDDKELPMRDTLFIPRNFGKLKMEVSIPHLVNTKNRYAAYAVTEEGATPVWIELPEDGAIVFSNLGSGKYHMKIRVLRGFGKDNYAVKDILLIIPGAWYRQIWFYLLLAALFAMSVWLFFKRRNTIALRNNAILQQKVKEKTGELQSTMEDLAKSKKNLERETALQEHLISAISHDIKTPLNYLNLVLERISQGLSEEGTSAFTDMSRLAELQSADMFKNVEKLTEYVKLRKGEHFIRMEQVKISEVITGKLNLFRSLGAERKTVITNRVEAGVTVLCNYPIAEIIITNIIDNAIKNTAGGTIDMDAAVTADAVVLSVKDTGFGMPPQIVEWLNEKPEEYKPADEHAEKPILGGLGTLLIKELCALVQVQLYVESAADEGTLIQLTFKKRIDPVRQALPHSFSN